MKVDLALLLIMENYELHNSSITDKWSNTLLAMIVLKALKVHVAQEYLMV